MAELKVKSADQEESSPFAQLQLPNQDVGAECSKGWSYRCASAKGAKCTCRCGGSSHGKARGQSKAAFFG